MSALLMRLAGPMQSWGTRSRFGNRDTGLEPSRSGVVGLLCAALGLARDHPLDDFAPDRLRMAVRVDREGRLMRDFHTAQNVRRADPSKGVQDTVLSERFYLADADFLVGSRRRHRVPGSAGCRTSPARLGPVPGPQILRARAPRRWRSPCRTAPRCAGQATLDQVAARRIETGDPPGGRRGRLWAGPAPPGRSPVICQPRPPVWFAAR